MSNYPKFKKIYERVPVEEKYLYQYKDGSMDIYAIKEFCINYTYDNYKGGKDAKTTNN